MQVEGRAPRKTSKKPSETDRKNDMKTMREEGSILEVFWPHFGRLWAPFWSSKALQKSSEILDAFLEAKKGGEPVIRGRPGGLRGPPGEDYGGVREPFFCRRNEDQGQGALSLCLARRPGWGGGWAARLAVGLEDPVSVHI